MACGLDNGGTAMIEITEKMLDKESLPTPILTSKHLYKIVRRGRKVSLMVRGHGSRKFVECTMNGEPALVDAKTGSIYVAGRCLSSDRLELAP
jgi:hypothetical protein